MGLTKKRKEILDVIRRLYNELAREPSYQEVADAVGAAKSTVQFHIENLRSEGYLDEGGTTLQRGHYLPLRGKVAAGDPIEHFKHDEVVEVPSTFLKEGRLHYVLQVEGDSMIDEHICDGDYVVVRKQDTAHNGQIVVANIDGSSTLKKFFKKRNKVELHPANEKYDPIVVKPPKKFSIEGVLSGVLRPIG